MPFLPSSASGGSGTTLVSANITQAAHGFVVGDSLYLVGTVYTKTNAASPSSAEFVGLIAVGGVVDANTFKISYDGLADLTGALYAPLVPGQVYYVSATIAGQLTVTEPISVSSVSKPVLIANSTTSGYIQSFRGSPSQGQTAVVEYGANTTITDAQTTASNGFVNVAGGSFVLPAGTYEVSYFVDVTHSAVGADVGFQLVDPLNVLIPSSVTKFNISIGASRAVGSQSVNIIVITPGTYQLQWRTSSATATLNNAVANGQSNVVWRQIGASPVPMDLAGEVGNNNSITDSQTTASTAFVDVANGSISIPSAGTFNIFYSVTQTNNGATNFNNFCIANGANVIQVGSVAAMRFPTANAMETINGQATVVTTGAATFKLRWLVSAGQGAISNLSTGAANTGASIITYQKITGFLPSSGQTVDFIYANNSAVQTLTNVVDEILQINTYVAGNIPLSGNIFTLTAGKTYEITAVTPFSSGANLEPRWFNVTAGSYIGTGGKSDSNAAAGEAGVATCILTPVVNTQIRLQTTLASVGTLGFATGNRLLTANVTIKQLGTSAAIGAIGEAAFQATSATVQSIPVNTNTTLTNWTQNLDTHGAFDPVTGIYTIPITGYWQFSGTAGIVAAATATFRILSITNQTVTVTYAQAQGLSVSTFIWNGSVSQLLKFNAGDQVKMVIHQRDAVAQNTSAATGSPQSFGAVFVHN